MENKQSSELNGVMHALSHLKDLEEARSNRYMYNVYDQFTQKFDRALQEKTINAIERALENGNIDELSTLSGIPSSNEFKKEYLEIF